MAEIHMERKQGKPWIWALLLGILLIGLLAWMFWPRRDTVELIPVATATTVTFVDPAAVPPAATAGATIATILASPQQWVGREFSGVVTVTEVPSDRGFWIEQDGQRMFVILYDEPAEVPIDINAGQQLRIRGTVRDAAYLPQVPGGNVTQATESIAREQPVYLVAGETAIEIMQGGQPG